MLAQLSYPFYGPSPYPCILMAILSVHYFTRAGDLAANGSTFGWDHLGSLLLYAHSRGHEHKSFC